MTEERTITIGAPVDPGNNHVDPAPVVKPRTPRLAIREHRQEIINNLHLDLKVPRLSTVDDSGTRDVIVRYGPVKSAKVDESLKRRAADEFAENEASLLVHTDVLINSCIGIYQVLDGDYTHKYALRFKEDGITPDDNPYEFTGNPSTEPFTRFDKPLGLFLGLTDFQCALAANICRALYLTDGDLIDASNQLSGWSSKSNEKVEEDFTKR